MDLVRSLEVGIDVKQLLKCFDGPEKRKRKETLVLQLINMQPSQQIIFEADDDVLIFV
jgi:hypothetical protein